MRCSRLARPFLLPSLLVLAPALGLAAEAEKLFYGVEMQGTIVGYLEVDVTPPAEPGEPLVVASSSFVRLTLMGQDFDVRSRELYHVDPATGRVLYFDGETLTGEIEVGAEVVVQGSEVRHTPRSGGAARTLELEPDVELEDSIHFPHVLADLAEGESREYRVFDYTSGEVHEVRYTRRGEETLALEGWEYPCVVFQVEDRTIGLSGELWVDPSTERLFKAVLSTGVTVQRAPAGVVGKIKRAELDDLLFAPVDAAIADFQGITYMKVKARIQTLGEQVTAESLVVPGQGFTGTVEGNVVDGVFEIEHRRYDGGGAPAFPAPAIEDEELAKLLEPEVLIEADDPVLVEHARGLTAGAADCWEAAIRLSQWVADEIVYEIPGGSARGTFDARKGECGSHSRLLVALCRGVGIPARLATGCMYTPNYGGTFGQHAWTEVHMGEAGWIPVDATANEIDYVDSGHVRLGSKASFQPESMEVLEYRVGSADGGRAAAVGSFADLPWRVGATYTYRYVAGGAEIGTDSFTVESREEREGRAVITVSTRLDLGARTVEGSFQIDERGRPVTYHVEGKAGAVEYTVDCRFSAGTVVEKVVQSGNPTEKTIDLPDEVYLLDNNNFAHYAFLVAALPMEEGAVVSFQAFHPSSMQLLPVQITVGGRETIAVGDAEVACTRCRLVIAGTPLELWVDGAGRVVRETEGKGRLVVELLP